jgi:uncharacterized membrane protein HdeD (DUF308 family)
LERFVFQQINAKRIREMAWWRISIFGLALAVTNCILLACGGVRVAVIIPWLFGLWACWFSVLTTYYGWVLRRDGVVVFPEPIWHSRVRKER